MSVENKFKEFLFPKLQSMEFDEDVFGNYILGILMTEEPMADKKESLLEFFTGAAEQDMSAFCEEICNEWSTMHKVFLEETVVEEVDFGERLANIMHDQVKSVAKVSSADADEKKFKDAILAQYSQVSDDEGDDGQGHIIHESSSKSCAVASHLARNANVQSVIDAEKDQREKSKMEYEKKKAQDKVNREKQKEKQQERKERERKRTLKTEHRR